MKQSSSGLMGGGLVKINPKPASTNDEVKVYDEIDNVSPAFLHEKNRMMDFLSSLCMKSIVRWFFFKNIDALKPNRNNLDSIF